MLNISDLSDVQNLSVYVQNILNRLQPTLGKLDDAKLDESSTIEINKDGRNWVLHLVIVPADLNIPFLSLSASSQYCMLGFGGGEQIECHSNPERNETLADMVVTSIERYLDGITVIESYNKNGKLIRKQCFFGIDAECEEKSSVGTAWYPIVFSRKIYSTKKTTFKFLK